MKEFFKQLAMTALMIILIFTFYVAPLIAIAVGLDILICYTNITIIHIIVLCVMMLVTAVIWFSIVYSTIQLIIKENKKRR
jgi:hypothetical protein